MTYSPFHSHSLGMTTELWLKVELVAKQVRLPRPSLTWPSSNRVTARMDLIYAPQADEIWSRLY